MTGPNDGAEDSAAAAEHPEDAAVDTQEQEQQPETDSDPNTDPAAEAGASTRDEEEVREQMTRAAFTKLRQRDTEELRRAKQQLEDERRALAAERDRMTIDAQDAQLLGLVRSNPELRDQFVDMVRPHLGSLPPAADPEVSKLREEVQQLRGERRAEREAAFTETMGATGIELMRQHKLTARQITELGARAIAEGEVSSAMSQAEIRRKLTRFVRSEILDSAETRGASQAIDQIERGASGGVRPSPKPPAPKEVDVTKLSRDELTERWAKKLGIKTGS